LVRFTFRGNAAFAVEEALPFFFFADLALIVVEDFFASGVFFDFAGGRDESPLSVVTFADLPPRRSLERIASIALLIGRLPFADESPTSAPATPPATAPTGPAITLPMTAPVTPPAVCFDTSGRFLSLVDFLGMIVFSGRLMGAKADTPRSRLIIAITALIRRWSLQDIQFSLAIKLGFGGRPTMMNSQCIPELGTLSLDNPPSIENDNPSEKLVSPVRARDR
jgi:hypothetical protein